MSKEVSNWLDKKISDYINPPEYELYNKSLEYYYKENDKNLKLSDEQKIQELIEFEDRIFDNSGEIKYESESEKIYFKEKILESRLVQKYFTGAKNKKLKNIFLNPNTRRYHANMLFNQILDYCYVNGIVDNQGSYLFNKFMRNDFYIFCFENS